MASSGKLIELVAGMFGLPKDRVAYAWRRLREEGAIITAGRGRSAPPVSALDAAHLVIATVADLPPKDTIEAWRTYAQAKAQFFDARTGDLVSVSWSFEHSELAGFDLPALTNLPAGHTFAEALAALITAASDGSLEEFSALFEGSRIWIELDSHRPSAVIYLRSLRYDLAVDYILESGEFGERSFYLHSRRAFEYPALIEIGELIASGERGKQ